MKREEKKSEAFISMGYVSKYDCIWKLQQKAHDFLSSVFFLNQKYLPVGSQYNRETLDWQASIVAVCRSGSRNASSILPSVNPIAKYCSSLNQAKLVTSTAKD